MAKPDLLKHICDGRVRLERRNGNPMIYARGYMQGKAVHFRTKQENPTLAEEAARDWWEGLRAKDKRKESVHGRLFSDVADAFIKHAQAHFRGEISDGQIEQYSIKWNVLRKFPRDPKQPDGAKWFDDVLITDIDLKFLVDLREARSQVTTKNFKRPVSPATLKKDLDFVIQVLRHAMDVEKTLHKLPPKPKFQGTRFKIAKRAQKALTMKQYNDLVAAAKAHASEPTTNIRTKRQREELLAFIRLSVMGGLRPSEAYSLRWVDCTEVTLNRRPAVELWVKGKHFRTTGKREEGYAIYQGVTAYRRLKKLNPDAKPDDLLFPKRSKQRKDAKPGAKREQHEQHADGVATMLAKVGVRTYKDEDGVLRARTAKCFRPTGISMWLRLAENPNLNDARKIFRTSLAEIEQCYDQNPVRSAASRMAKWKGEPKDFLKKLEVVDDAAREQEGDEAPDAVPGELVGDERDEMD